MPTNPNTGGALGGLQYDEQGRPYFLTADGQRNYVSPAAMGGEAPKDETGFFRSRPRWNTETAEYETPFDWGNALNMGVMGLFGAGVPHAFGAFGGAGGGGGTAGASALLSEGATGAGLPTAGMTPGLIGGSALLSEGAAGAGLPTAGMTPGLIGEADPGMDYGSLTNLPADPGWRGGGDIRDILKRLGMIAGTMGIGKVLGGGGGTNIPPEIQQILDLQKQRMQLQNPLFEAISRLAMSRLPTAQQQAMPGGQGVDPLAAAQRLSQQGGR